MADLDLTDAYEAAAEVVRRNVYVRPHETVLDAALVPNILGAALPHVVAQVRAQIAVEQRALHTEWAVEHAQGRKTGDYGRPMTEKQARAWAEENTARDATRQLAYRGKTRVVRREATDWYAADEGAAS